MRNPTVVVWTHHICVGMWILFVALNKKVNFPVWYISLGLLQNLQPGVSLHHKPPFVVQKPFKPHSQWTTLLHWVMLFIIKNMGYRVDQQTVYRAWTACVVNSRKWSAELFSCLSFPDSGKTEQHGYVVTICLNNSWRLWHRQKKLRFLCSYVRIH